jgi:brefeldin A-inhibited guanine nucleotide-exchange protein
MSVPGSMDTSTMGLSEAQLRRQGLECLVTVLRSLVSWGTAPKMADDGTSSTYGVQIAEDTRRESHTPDASVDRLSSAGASVEGLRVSSADATDDPTMFESAKQKKTTLLEGIKKFNFKPKRVSYLPQLVLYKN